MTLSTTVLRADYVTNGATTSFVVPFRFLAKEHLRIIVTTIATGVVSTLGANEFTVTGAGDPLGGAVIIFPVLASGRRVSILRDVPFTQLRDYSPNDPFPAESHEEALDLLTMETQQLREVLDRAVLLSPSNAPGVNLQIPIPQASYFLGWNSSATALQNYDPASLATVVAYGTARSDIFTADGATTAFTLSMDPVNINNLDISVAGVTQVPGLDFALTGVNHTLVFYSAPPSGTKILARYMQGLPVGTTGAGSINYTPPVAGASSRPLDHKLLELVSVEDFGALPNGVDATTSVQNAINNCLLTGKQLLWPSSVGYLITGSITGLHGVRHWGPGKLIRQSSTFHVEPKGPAVTNTLYVSTSGNDANDGITPAQPKATFQGCFDALVNYGPLLDGNWVISAAAGTYSAGQVSTLQGVSCANVLDIKGPTVGHPNIPTCIIDGLGTGANYSHGFGLSGVGLRVRVSDIKFIRFNGDPSGDSRGALLFDNGCDAYTTNVHCDGSSWFGIYLSRQSSGRISGGILNACRNGANTDGGKVSFGYGASSLAQGTIVRNCTEAGLYFSRGADGHADYCLLEDNAIGIYINAGGSRVDAVGSDFRRNTYGYRTANGGAFGDNPYTPCQFNHGGPDANLQAVGDRRAYTGDVAENISSTSEMRVGFDRTVRTITGTGPQTISTPYSVVAGRLRGAGRSLRVSVKGVFTQVSAATTLSVAIGAAVATLQVPGAGTNVGFFFEAELIELSGGYRWCSRLMQSASHTRVGSAGATFSNDIVNAIAISANLGLATDSLTVHRIDVYITG